MQDLCVEEAGAQIETGNAQAQHDNSEHKSITDKANK